MVKVSESQKQAIIHNKGPMLVLAGPGSGKTLVIIRRTQYLIEQYGVNPGQILVITFTKAAANEMQERFERLMGVERSSVNFGTFHAVFFKILRYAYNYNASNIITEEERYKVLRDIIVSMHLEIEDEKEFLEGIAGEISLVKAETMDISHYYSMNCSEENFIEIYNSYEKKLREMNKIDFDDMLVLCYELLSQRPDILAMWQKKYQYILIDEFQDINKIQFEIIQLLAKPLNNLFVVGDDDQSIYRFRGAKPEIMLSFEKIYKNTTKVVLGENYRSKANIVEGALRVVENNKRRFAKKIIATKESGKPIDVKSFKDLPEENQAVIDGINAYRKQGYLFSQIAVLYRTNTQPGALCNKMMEYNIPFKMRDTIPNIYEHWIARDIISYIKLAMGSRDRGLFLQIINRPKRYISRDCFDDTTVSFETMQHYYEDKPYVVERIEKLEYDLALLQRTNPFAAINYIRRAIGYDAYLKEYADYRRIKVDELYDILGELQENAREFKTYEDWFRHMEEFKQGLIDQANKAKQKEVDSVMMTTFHAAKGLEFEVVFIIDANEGITPHKKAVVVEDLEEERRMFYVAMTRAKERLHIYSVKQRYNKELFCSRFVGELLCGKSSLKEGQRIIHKMYGEGVIKTIDENKITIKFDKILIPKVLALDFCISNQMIRIADSK
ncbi:MAG: ATP-dependent helicase [Clostridiales bacterium]|nr:ATP-dependent helicase [Clostridiales bacterium]